LGEAFPVDPGMGTKLYLKFPSAVTFPDPPCVTDTFAGLPVAPLAVTWIAPVRDPVPLFAA